MISASRFSCSLISGYFLSGVSQSVGILMTNKTKKEEEEEEGFTIPLRQPVIQRRRIHAQHHDQVDPALGEEVAGVSSS
jgi:hypothetical protein